MINSELRMDALECVNEVSTAIARTNGIGITVKELSALLGFDYNKASAISGELEVLGVVKNIKICGAKYIVPAGSSKEDYEPLLTVKQEAVLRFLTGHRSDEDTVSASIKRIGGGSGFRNSCQATLDALDKKGFIEIVDRGGPTRVRTYKVWPNGDGPKGYSAVWFGGKPRLSGDSEYSRGPAHLIAEIMDGNQ